MSDSLTAKTKKGERTREAILEAAMKLFREHGYEATTMRAVAQEAGVSVGNAYYYFPSKEHLVQSWYGRIVADATEAAEEVLAAETSLQKRLAGVLHKKLDIIEPYHRFSVAIARGAMDPASPISPFSADSRAVRGDAIALTARIVEGSKERIHKDLRAQLPEMLWLVMEGIALYWVYDNSPGRERTRGLIDDLSDLVARLSKMAGLPLLGSVRKLVLRMVKNAIPHELKRKVLPKTGEVEQR
jgi:AcrR family transcriptional regulator